MQLQSKRGTHSVGFSTTHFSPIRLSTPRVCLRPLGPGDAVAVHALLTDPGFLQFDTHPPLASLSQAQAQITADEHAMREGTRLRLGLERLNDNALIGLCSLFNLNADCRSAELSYGLRFDAWGVGYMHESLRALLAHGFTDLALNRIQGGIDPRNTLAARSLERLGFKKEGLLRENALNHGERVDSALYGLLQREWLAPTDTTQARHSHAAGCALGTASAAPNRRSAAARLFTAVSV